MVFLVKIHCIVFILHDDDDDNDNNNNNNSNNNNNTSLIYHMYQVCDYLSIILLCVSQYVSLFAQQSVYW